MKNKYILTLFLLFIGFNGFSERVMEKVIEIPWNIEDGCKVEKLPSGNYGISSFQIISDNEVAVLCETENKIKIYNLKTKNLSYQFSYDKNSSCQLFRYSEKVKLFYLYDNNKGEIMVLSRDGKLIKKIPVSRNVSRKGIVQLQVIDDNLNVVCGYRSTFTLIKNGYSLSPEKQDETIMDGVFDEKGHIIKIDKIGKTNFEIISSESPQKKYPISFDWDYTTDMKYIGGNEYFFAFVVIHLTPEEDKNFQCKLVFYSRINNKINNSIDMPHIYFTSQYNSIEFFDNTIYQLFTKPTHAVVLKHTYGEINSSDIDKAFDFDYPQELFDFDKNDLFERENQIYNDSSYILEESKEQQNEKYFNGNTNTP
ncbi:MAG: hypothetical protein ACOC4J_06550, partial [Bacteroidota bacterium]